MRLVRHSAHFLSSIEAVQRVFIPFATLSSPFYRHQHRHCPNPLLPLKVRHYQSSRGTSESKHTRSRRHDDAINDQLVQVVSQDSNALLPPENPRAILARINRKTHSLVEVSPSIENRVAVCRILSKEEAFKHKKASTKKLKTKEKPPKLLELSWTIDPNDLRHKLDRMKGFLEGGRKVDLTIANKRARGARSREVTKEDRDKLLASVRGFAHALDGVREWKAMAELGGNRNPAEDGKVNMEMVQQKPKGVTVVLYFDSDENVKSS